MLEEHRWGLAIPVSQIACEGPSKTHLAGNVGLKLSSGRVRAMEAPENPD
jgi:hypothetical protein